MKLWVAITLGIILAVVFIVAFIPQLWFPVISRWPLFSKERSPQLFVTPAPRYPDFPPAIGNDCAEFLFQNLCLSLPWEVVERAEFAGRVRFLLEGERRVFVSTNAHNPDFARVLLSLFGPRGELRESFFQSKNIRHNYDLMSLVLSATPDENDTILPSEMPAQFLLLTTKLFHTPRGSDLVIQRFSTGRVAGFQFGIAGYYDPIKIYCFDKQNREYTLIFSGQGINQSAIDGVLWSLEPI